MNQKYVTVPGIISSKASSRRSINMGLFLIWKGRGFLQCSAAVQHGHSIFKHSVEVNLCSHITRNM